MSGKKLAQTATFVLLPVRGLRSDEMRSVGSNTRAFANAASSRFEVLADTAPREPTMRLIHSIGETGPKLVEMGAEEIAAMRVSDPGVRAVPVVLYELARRPIFEVEATVIAAAWDISVAVSSAGKKGTYPATSNEILDEVAPFATTDPAVYISGFSNTGPEVDLTGPGEGIVSTLPGGKYGVMSGTSMACPRVTGFAAALLSANHVIRGLPRNRDRSIAIVGMLNQAAKPLGLDPTLEGAGLLS